VFLDKSSPFYQRQYKMANELSVSVLERSRSKSRSISPIQIR